MTIEINRNSEFTYRINHFSPTLIDRRVNRHGARWQPYQRCATAEEARVVLFALEKPTETEGDE